MPMEGVQRREGRPGLGQIPCCPRRSREGLRTLEGVLSQDAASTSQGW